MFDACQTALCSLNDLSHQPPVAVLRPFGDISVYNALPGPAAKCVLRAARAKSIHKRLDLDVRTASIVRFDQTFEDHDLIGAGKREWILAWNMQGG